jgi:hypothetical protein
VLRSHADHEAIAKAIYRVGPKPVSDGASTDAEANHYFTNVGESGIDVLTAAGELRPLVRDARLSWPDALSFGGDGWLYVATNQLHLSPPLHGGVEGGGPPFGIYRVWTGTRGVPGR